VLPELLCNIIHGMNNIKARELSAKDVETFKDSIINARHVDLQEFPVICP